MVLVVSAVTSLADTSPRKIYQKALPSVMTLDVENQAGDKFVGSAIVVLADDIALTAWHVVADARSVLATFSDGTQVQVVGCIDKDEARDLALLQLEKALPGRRAVLNRELGLIEEVHPWSGAAGMLEQERRHSLAEGAHLIRLMVVNCEPIALAIPDAMNVAPVDQHAPAARAIAAGDELEQCRFAGAIGTEKADRARLRHGEIGFEVEGLAARPAGRVVTLLERFDAQ